MHLAKAQGKNRFVIYADGMAEAARRRAELQQDLALAVPDDQLVVHYQPTVRLTDGRTTGFEALVRWNHPDRGMVPPAEFIPLAEESGVITEHRPLGPPAGAPPGRGLVGRHRDAAAHGRQPLAAPVPDDDVVADVEAALRRQRVPRRAADPRGHRGRAGPGRRPPSSPGWRRSAALGVRIAIDDFGTGFSGLSYLRHLPADIIKIDRSFVGDLPGGRSATTLITSIVELARTLGLDVVAEGVETEEQRRALARAATAAQAQGYLFARPEPADRRARISLPGADPRLTGGSRPRSSVSGASASTTLSRR